MKLPDTQIVITEAATLAALPDAARALFGQDAFSTLAWYGATLAAGLPDGARATFQLAHSGGQVLAVFPMLRHESRLGALATPYTCLWRPLLAPGLPAASLIRIGQALATPWRRHGVVRLEAMPAGDPAMAAILAGLRQAGLRTLGFDHFGNWHAAVAGLTWAEYLAARPGSLRSTIKRAQKRLMQANGAVFTLVDSPGGLEPAIAAYEAVYAQSWKQPEPYPAFNATLMRACAATGTLRLGTITLAGAPIASQFWLVHGHWAGVLKLAHDEAHRQLAPGTVLTALMIRHVMESDGAQALDFGRGDDGYKQDWTGARRQRVGVLVVDPWRAPGVVVRHWVGQARKSSFLKKRTKKLLRPVG